MKEFISLLTVIGVLELKPTVVPHEDYQNSVMGQLRRKHYSGNVLTIVNNDWPIIYKLWITALSYLTCGLGSPILIEDQNHVIQLP
ncbi:hypothetical protein [Lederbergia citrea]|uniref:hypothetical protein n=1 Tax=Lederbergia citrea TaxID=2833581 RepID=UPI001BCA3D6F|nr:hypothetical protein [Lederbergia citrea]MBS4202499.1 hypothetical protein [Lederbergia citrea]